jgi:PAS domain S-box-containing protein
MTRKSRFIDESGKRYLVGIIRDISDRKQAETELADEKERLAVTLSSIGDGVITTDTAGNVLLLNRAAEELTGWSSAEAEGRPLAEVFRIVHETTREPCADPIRQVVTHRETIELANHTSLISRSGREYAIADSAAPIRDNSGEVIGVVLVFRDVTDKQTLEGYVRKSQKLESLGLLAGGIAHDFNNLLGAIFGYADIALEETSEPSVAEYLRKSLSNIDRARALTQQLLTFAKGGAPQLALANLATFTQETVEFALSSSSIRCRFEIAEDLKPCLLDQNQISQVIENLTINAQQAMPVGGTLTVSLANTSVSEDDDRPLVAGEYLRLSISDQGTGIPAEHLPKIFDPYFTTRPTGHGLGLSTCFSIVARHDGYIDVETRLDVGTTFHVYLPVASGIEETVRRTPGTAHEGSGHFLVMDDEEGIRDLLEIALTGFGYTVSLTASGDEARDLCRARAAAGQPLAGMIFDLTVPGGRGGKEVIADIREVYPDVPAFVVSGYSEDPVMSRPEDFGFQASLSKPFTRQALATMLSEHLQGT